MNLFPDISESELGPRKGRGRKTGHAAPLGTGPDGETCRSCLHYCVVRPGANTYRKCGLMRDEWTHGPGTDIRARDAACRCWEAQESAKVPDSG